MDLTPTSPDLFFTKNDPADPRLGDWVRKAVQAKPQFHILGYPDDEGIRLNGGRPGAAFGPYAIRQAFYKMTPSPVIEKNFSILDAGDIKVSQDLAGRHEAGRQLISNILQKGDHWISLGGGHDYAYCDSTAFVQHYKAQKPLVVNFDAHLDVRPTDKGFNSGTPFFRLMQECGPLCHFIEVGLQTHCNSPQHTQWLKEHGGQILWRDQIDQQGMPEALQKLVPLSIHPAFISVDIDAFSSAIAPGCSQSWASGLEWNHFAAAFDFLIEAFDVRGLGIYEVSPPLDQDNQTSKLAAVIMHRFIFNTLKKSTTA